MNPRKGSDAAQYFEREKRLASDSIDRGEPHPYAGRYNQPENGSLPHSPTFKLGRALLNEVFEAERVPWAAYGTFSMLELFTNPEGVKITPTKFDPLQYSFAALKGDRNAGVVHKMRLGMMVHGVDFSSHPGGVVSATHGEAELEDTVSAMRKTVRMLRAEGEL